MRKVGRELLGGGKPAVRGVAEAAVRVEARVSGAAVW